MKSLNPYFTPKNSFLSLQNSIVPLRHMEKKPFNQI
jgi:hypothetical protein